MTAHRILTWSTAGGATCSKMLRAGIWLVLFLSLPSLLAGQDCEKNYAKAEALYNDDKAGEALALIDKTIKSCLEKGGLSDSLYSDMLHLRGGIFYDDDEYEKAIASYRPSHVFAVKSQSPLRIYKSANNLGLCFYYLGTKDSAEVYYQKALQVFENGKLAKKKIRFPTLLYNYAKLKKDKEDYEEARDLLFTALAYYDSLGVKEDKYDALDLMAEVLLELEQLEMASNYLDQQQALLKIICEKPGADKEDCAINYNNLGVNFNSAAEPEKAIPNLRRSIELYLSVKQPDFDAISKAYSTMGQCNMDQKAYGASETNLNEARIYALKLKDKNQVASVLYDMGNLYLQMDRLDLAEKAMMESLALYEAKNKTSDDVADAYLQLSKLYKKQNLTQKQEEYLVRYKDIYKMNHKDKDSHAVACRTLGSAYRESGQYLKAEREFLESVSIYRRLNPTGMNLETSLELLAGLYRLTDRYDKADSVYDLAIKLYELNKEIGLEYADVFYFKAMNNQNRGNYGAAMDMVKRSLEISRKKAGKSSDYAQAVAKMGGIYNSMGDFAKARSKYLEALHLFDSLGETASRVTQLRNLANLEFAAGNKGAAFSYMKKGLGQSVAGKLSESSIAYAQHDLASLYRQTYQFDSAALLYSAVKRFYLAKFGRLSGTYADLLSGIAWNNYYRNRMDSTELLIRERVEINREMNVNSKAYALALYALADYYFTVDRFQEAEELYLKSLQLERSITGETIALAYTLRNVGWFYYRLGDLTQAEKYYHDAISIVERINGKDCVDYANVLNNIAILHKARGLYTKAEELQLQQKRIEESKRGKGSSAYAIVMMNLGSLYAAMGLQQKTIQCYAEASAIRMKIFGKESDMYASAVNSLASAYREVKDYHKADSLYSIVLAVRKKYFGENHPVMINTVYDQADYTEERGLYQKSLSEYETVIQYRSRVYGPNNLNTLYPVEEKGVLLSSMGNYPEALKHLAMTLPQYEKAFGANHPTYARVNRSIGLAQLNQRHFKEAGPYLNAMLAVRYFQVEKLFSSMTERQREEFYRSIKDDFGLFNAYALIQAGKIDFLGKKNPTPDQALIQELYNNQIATKALLLTSSSRLRKQIISGSDKKLKEGFFEWEKLKAQLASLYQKVEGEVEATGDAAARKIARDSLEERIDKIERELSAKSERFAKASEKKKYTWKDVKSALKPGEAAVEIVRLQKYGIKEWVTDTSDPKKTKYPRLALTDSVFYVALIITPETIASPEVVVLQQGNAMEAEFQKVYQNGIYQRKEDLVSYDRYWKPIGSNSFIKGKVKRIFFSPDGIYNQISVNSLQNPETKKYVIDEVKVELVTNTKDILMVKLPDAQNFYGLFMGNPTFYVSGKSVPTKESTRSYSLVRGGNLASLPGAEKEVEAIGHLLDSMATTSGAWQPEVLKGKEATEDKIKNMDNPRVLHIATHGFFEQSAAAQGTRGVEMDEVVAAAKVQGVKLNPMLSSGLFLQGGGDALSRLKTFDYELLERDDGILTAYEAMNLNIENTDLVVLSACETGLGEVNNGEGVYGLQRALKVAGANSIVMSLWSVSDDATMLLMQEFYKRWLGSGDKSGSFREAQLAVRSRKEFSHPFFWSAFVMVGN